VGEWDHGRLQAKIIGFFLTRYEAQGMRVVAELRLRAAPGRVRIPDVCVFLTDPKQRVPSTPPFLCIEILSPEDRMSRLEVRIADFLAMGVGTVWVLDPETRQSFTAHGRRRLARSQDRRVADGVSPDRDACRRSVRVARGTHS
jgi:Uma2 family endonuclease